jgi:hypothetical protein
MSKSVDTVDKQRPAHLFKPGQSGNPNGRPKGARSRLSADFLSDLHATWSEHGATALRLCATTDPRRFCSIVAGLLPRDIRIDQIVTIEPSEFLDRFRQAQALLGNVKAIEHGE